jgi:predicted tellurium resistance membrane protein TerC
LALIGGGLFLLAKSVLEIHAAVEGGDDGEDGGSMTRARSFGILGVIVQIALVDVVFSLDSVFTAIGFAQRIEVMVAAIVLAMMFMMLVSARISHFIEQHPTVKVLALAFLILVGVALIADGLDQHIPKGYLYFAMAFAMLVEMVNMRARARRASTKA